ncbi:hypothetical protein AAG570_008513 [Ranatra chinensis]|uniref:Protein stoned-A n=1 Tax=Ranatra chinensis TaxID=642074 RepID=A0ABD0ZEF2_9HEMI
MLKITKGLKKKKKGKKSKHKEEELFEAAELEQYRREHQLKEGEGDHHPSTAPEEESEEWKKFKALTSGVDDILKKTQGDLDRIKSTSYFQRKPPGQAPAKEEETKEPKKASAPPKEKKWVDFEKEGLEEEGDSRAESEAGAASVGVESSETASVEPEVAEEEEVSEEEDPEEDDIFDTSYVDVVASGQVKLAYIPESPQQEEESFDPFDTSIVEKVIKFDPNEKKKNLVSLNCAVEVLTGKVEKPSCASEKTWRRRRPLKHDLLLGSFDEDTPHTEDKPKEVEVPPKSILDEDPVFEEETSAVIGLPPATPLTETKPICATKKDSVDPLEKSPEKVSIQVLAEEFEPLRALSKEPKKAAPPTRPPAPPREAVGVHDLSDTEDQHFGDDQDDPFDTSFAANVLPGKFELKIIEKEILKEVTDAETFSAKDSLQCILNTSLLQDDFGQHGRLSLNHRDLLGGSTTDLSNIPHSPIKPETSATFSDELSETAFSDPFDTSAVENLVAPGKTELKFLEKEFLSKVEQASLQIDNDFDPRAGESSAKPNRPDQLPLHGKKLSIPKVVAFDIKSPSNRPDLLAVGHEEGSKVNKPLTPYYPKVEEQVEKAVDPFDTSFVTNCPGKVELKLLESELVGETELKHSLSDPEFNPREETPAGVAETARNPPVLDDIISCQVGYEFSAKLHTPVTPRPISQEFQEDFTVDPFDTSIADVLVPGKAEIKLIEHQLVYPAETEPSTLHKISLPEIIKPLEVVNENSLNVAPVPDVLNQTDENIADKPLTPLIASSSIDYAEDFDPFDTSTVGVIAPGKTELKLIESELMSN